jgi:hypothetical protein
MWNSILESEFSSKSLVPKISATYDISPGEYIMGIYVWTRVGLWIYSCTRFYDYKESDLKSDDWIL